MNGQVRGEAAHHPVYTRYPSELKVS